MTLTIQEIIDGFKNTRDTTYRRLCCLNRAKQEIRFKAVNYDPPRLDDPQDAEFRATRRIVTNGIDRMAAIIIFGSDAGNAPKDVYYICR